MHRVMSFISFGKFLAIIHSNTFFRGFLFLHAFWHLHYEYIDVVTAVPLFYEALLTLLHSFSRYSFF